jgi:hypothetical protein
MRRCGPFTGRASKVEALQQAKTFARTEQDKIDAAKET